MQFESRSEVMEINALGAEDTNASISDFTPPNRHCWPVGNSQANSD